MDKETEVTQSFVPAKINNGNGENENLFGDGNNPANSHQDQKEDKTTIAFENGTKEDTFFCLKKEDLMKYSTDPYWVRLRIALLLVFVIMWLAMLVSAIIIIVVTPKCPPKPELNWWDTALIYYIHPATYYDSNGDGVGDFKGISKKLPYLKKIGVTAVNLGPIQTSPLLNLGYDISSYTDINQAYGSIKEFDDLRRLLHKNGIKLILDFIPSMTSDKHPWFLASRNSSNIDKYRDFYIWDKGSNGKAPNDQKSLYGESAWKLDNKKDMYFYHSLTENEPELNLKNPQVIKEIDEAMLFWLKKKVDGFRLVGIGNVFRNFENENETISLVQHWKELVDNFSLSETKRSQIVSRLLLIDLIDINQTISFLQNNKTLNLASKAASESHGGAFVVVNKMLTEFDSMCNTDCLCSKLDGWFKLIKNHQEIANSATNWQLGNADVSRVTSRINDSVNKLDTLHILLLTLPGTSFVFYGDEIGMLDIYVIDKKENGLISTDNNNEKLMNVMPNQNLNSSVNLANSLAKKFNSSFWSNLLSEKEKVRERGRRLSPMHWSDNIAGGFSSHKDNSIEFRLEIGHANVESQLGYGSGQSHLKVFMKMASLRLKEPSLQWGDFQSAQHRNIYYFLRKAEGHSAILVAINFGDTVSGFNVKRGSLSASLWPGSVVNYKSNINNIDQNNEESTEENSVKGEVLFATDNSEEKSFEEGNKIDIGGAIILQSKQGLVLKIQERKKIGWF